MTRRSLAAATAVAFAALTILPGGVAHAKAVPSPRSDEWWFRSWDIQNKVWPLSRGAGVTVAIIDTGVNASLPGLSDAVLPGTDLDTNRGDGRTDTDAQVGRGHGTSMAELIAGQGQDFGVVGVAPEAKILPIVATNISEIGPAITYAADHGAKVINISEGYPDLNLQGHVCLSAQTAVAYAAQRDVVVVASAGNEGSTSNRLLWPADCPGVLAVGAIDGKKIPWTASERQPYVSVSAPGIQIGSVFKGHVGWNDRRYAKANGTSDAAALASGAIALVRAKNPNLSARQVVQRVINTAVDAGPPGRDVYTGSGAMIPYRSMTQDVPATAPNPPYAQLDKYLTAHQQPALPTPTTPSGAGKKSSSSSPLLIAVIVGVVVLLIIVVIGLLLARRNRGGGRPMAKEQPFPGPSGPRPYPPGPGGYGPQGWGSQRPPEHPSERPVGRPQGPPSSFLPPEDRGGRPG